MAKLTLHLHHHYPRSIDRKLDRIMANLADLQAAAAKVSEEVAEAIAALEDLRIKVEEGTVNQADIDAITATLTGAATQLDTATGADVPVDPEEPVEPQL